MKLRLSGTQQVGTALSEYALIKISLYLKFSQNHISIVLWFSMLFEIHFEEFLPTHLFFRIKRDPSVLEIQTRPAIREKRCRIFEWKERFLLCALIHARSFPLNSSISECDQMVNNRTVAGTWPCSKKTCEGCRYSAWEKSYIYKSWGSNPVWKEGLGPWLPWIGTRGCKKTDWVTKSFKCMSSADRTLSPNKTQNHIHYAMLSFLHSGVAILAAGAFLQPAGIL